MNLFKRVFSGLNPKVFVVLTVTTVGLTLLIVGGLILRDLLQDRKINRAEQLKMAYNLEQLDKTIAGQTQSDILYFEDLLELSFAVQPYRENPLPWSEEDVREFWIPPDRSDIDYFTQANHKLVWEILKNAP